MPALNETAPQQLSAGPSGPIKNGPLKINAEVPPHLPFLIHSLPPIVPKMNGIRLSYELYHMQGHSSMINIISDRSPTKETEASAI